MNAAKETEVSPDKLDQTWLQTAGQKSLYRWGMILTFGGILGMKKLILRLILSKNKSLPKNTSQFFNYASERFLLQKAGQSYRFVHEMLQEHIAKMWYIAGEWSYIP